jgi:hypothetical protein
MIFMVTLAILTMVFTICAMILDILIIKGARNDDPHPDDQLQNLSSEEFAIFMEKVDSGMSVPDAMEDIWGEN